MRNTLPSAPVAPSSAIQEAIKEKGIFEYEFSNCSFITEWSHSIHMFPGVKLTNLIFLMDEINPLPK